MACYCLKQYMMDVDLCQACGDEHENSQGDISAKCKVMKAKLSCKVFKSEQIVEDEILWRKSEVKETADKNAGNVFVRW